MQINNFTNQINPYVSFKGTSQVAFNNLVAEPPTAQSEASPSFYTTLIGILTQPGYLLKKPFTDEELRIANTTGELPERYCIAKMSNRVQIHATTRPYLLIKGSVDKMNNGLFKKLGIDDTQFLSKLPEGYKIFRQKGTNYCIVAQADKELKNKWETLA